MEDNNFNRMQQLAGLITENEVKEAAPEMDALSVDLSNTPDEVMLGKAIEANSTLKSKLATIGSASELDGFFKILLSYTQLSAISKSTIMSSLKKALDDMSAEPSITTKEQ
jgi:hypothetical protein